MARRRSRAHGFFHEHSLSLAAAGILTLWICLYSASSQHTHLGSFFGNAVADWSGVVVMVFAAKYLYERGSAGTRQPRGHLRSGLLETARNHALTIFLTLTGSAWVVLYLRMNPEAKWGQVVGNIVSEWTQLLGLVLLTKRFLEQRSGESRQSSSQKSL